ncbi:unnamed protein product [Dibothriocephalus latus]|uniref:Uncharacterized protein n=1 Tax=Dibothriocephalus latus TaxID=60516 RepID=A0A3P7LH87_DIBLA|nr:unnamed protein product [Dibothriocephalus latus]
MLFQKTISSTSSAATQQCLDFCSCVNEMLLSFPRFCFPSLLEERHGDGRLLPSQPDRLATELYLFLSALVSSQYPKDQNATKLPEELTYRPQLRLLCRLLERLWRQLSPASVQLLAPVLDEAVRRLPEMQRRMEPASDSESDRAPAAESRWRDRGERQRL